MDLAVMDQEVFCDVTKPAQRIVVLVSNGLFTHVSAGHHQRQIRIREQQMMQRRVRQHNPKLSLAGSYCFGYWNVIAFAQEHDRTRVGAQKYFVFIGNQAELLDRSKIPRHEGKGFLFAMFPRPKAPHGGMLQRITGQMISAETFHRQNGTLPQQTRRSKDRISLAALATLRIEQPNARAAARASIWLRMKAPVGGIMEF